MTSKTPISTSISIHPRMDQVRSADAGNYRGMAEPARAGKVVPRKVMPITVIHSLGIC